MSQVVPTQFRILFKEIEEGEWLAHCLELDIVTTADTADQVEKDIIDLIIAQVTYAIENDNMHNLYRDAPREVWDEFFQCSIDQVSDRYHPPDANGRADIDSPASFPFFTKACRSLRHCHA